MSTASSKPTTWPKIHHLSASSNRGLTGHPHRKWPTYMIMPFQPDCNHSTKLVLHSMSTAHGLAPISKHMAPGHTDKPHATSVRKCSHAVPSTKTAAVTLGAGSASRNNATTLKTRNPTWRMAEQLHAALPAIFCSQTFAEPCTACMPYAHSTLASRRDTA
jgi:hypothetical protein